MQGGTRCPQRVANDRRTFTPDLRRDYGRGAGVGCTRGNGVDLGVAVGFAVGVAHGVPCPWHQVMWTVSTRQPSPEPVESLAIRHRSLVLGV